MQLSRRQFVATSSLAIAATALRDLPLVAQGQPPTRFETLRGGVGIFIGRGGTIGWLVTGDGAVVVDSQFADTAADCLAGMQTRSERGIEALINTHHHADHTGGNGVFKPAVERIVAHASVPGLQKQAAVQSGTEQDQAYPDTTFDDSWSMAIGGETVSAVYHGPGHTGGDIAVFFENANIVHVGDLMFNHRHPFVDRVAGASVRGWITCLERIVAEHDAETTYIFGHAKEGLPVTGTRADLQRMRDYFSALLEHVQQGIAAGRSRDEITALETLEGFEDYASNPPRATLDGALGVTFDELTADR